MNRWNRNYTKKAEEYFMCRHNFGNVDGLEITLETIDSSRFKHEDTIALQNIGNGMQE